MVVEYIVGGCLKSSSVVSDPSASFATQLNFFACFNSRFTLLQGLILRKNKKKQKNVAGSSNEVTGTWFDANNLDMDAFVPLLNFIVFNNLTS